MSCTRITRITVAALGAFAMTLPIATADASTPGSDAAQLSADEATAVVVGAPVRSDAAQLSADETTPVAVRAPDRSDAAQRTPGEISPVVVPVQDSTPLVSVDDGFDWGSAAIGAGSSLLVLTLIGAGGVAISRRHHAPLAS
jgi:hypothetical protein